MDVEAVLIEELPALIEDTRCVTELPANLEDALPIVEVGRIGGPRRELLDLATVDLDCYAATRQEARTLAYSTDKALRALVGKKVTGGEVTRVDTITGPNWRPYDNTKLRRFGLTVQITVQPRT